MPEPGTGSSAWTQVCELKTDRHAVRAVDGRRIEAGGGEHVVGGGGICHTQPGHDGRGPRVDRARDKLGAHPRLLQQPGQKRVEVPVVAGTRIERRLRSLASAGVGLVAEGVEHVLEDRDRQVVERSGQRRDRLRGGGVRRWHVDVDELARQRREAGDRVAIDVQRGEGIQAGDRRDAGNPVVAQVERLEVRQAFKRGQLAIADPCIHESQRREVQQPRQRAQIGEVAGGRPVVGHESERLQVRGVLQARQAGDHIAVG